MVRSASLGLTAVLLLGGVLCAEPPAPELLPPPRESEALPASLPVPAGSFRVNRWDVWRYYDVDRRGNFRPVVVYSPYGSYYLYNGAPYPWTMTHQLEFAPRVMDTPYRSYMPYIVD